MGSMTELTAADGHELSAYVAGSEGATRGLVVIQEIFGVNHHIRNVCDGFAAHGYAVIAPALFDRAERGVELGYTQDDIDKGREYRMRLGEADIINDLAAAASAPLLAGKKLGIVGYCFGGTVAWWGATRTRLFAAASCWYGGGIAGTKDERPNCPVQMHFGETDASIPMSDVEAIRRAQPGVQVYVYPGAGHGFSCDERASYNKEASELAWERTLSFFATHLGA